jgi:hypothetical protein
MAKFLAIIARKFEVEVQADTLQNAEAIARQIVGQLGTAKLLSVRAEGVADDTTAPPLPPRGRPDLGGSPGTPVVKTEILVDQIAKVA